MHTVISICVMSCEAPAQEKSSALSLQSLLAKKEKMKSTCNLLQCYSLPFLLYRLLNVREAQGREYLSAEGYFINMVS